jgi:CheY-like chemotaxis protein
MKGRVLVVDDESLIRRSLKRALASITVDVAENGRRGLEMALADEYDVILCDLMMPDVSGMELYELLSGTRPDIAERVVFMTGGAFTTAARDFLDRVPNLYLEKPFDVAQLRALIVERAGRSRGT